jgi:hypothetical protein
VHHNEIHHQIRYAFGGLNIGHMNAGKRDANGNNWKGNHYGSHFFQNRVSSKPGMLMYGLSVGSHPFTADTETYVVYNAGTFTRNTSTGAQVNLLVDGVLTGEIYANSLETPQGHRSEYNNCRVSANYISGHASFSSQGGYTPMTIDNGVCQPY